jgi:hypothetical protein
LLPELKESGFKSEKIDHDQIVTAVHIGDLLLTNAPHLQLFTEQELRRYEVEFYPEWVPKSKIHRPDGYWMSHGTSQSKLIALEVELSSKRDADYESVGMFYARRMEIRDVIWVVHNVKFASRIAKLICEAESGKRMRHSFFLVSDIKEFGWGAKVRVGPILGCSLRAILNENFNNPQLETIEKPSRNEQDQYSHELLFDFRKSRTKFADYKFS